MSRPQTLVASLMLLALAAATSAHAQTTATTPPAVTPPAVTPPAVTPPAVTAPAVTPTAPQPTIDPVVITSTPQAPTATPTTVAPQAPAPIAEDTQPAAPAEPPIAPARVTRRVSAPPAEAPLGEISSPFSVMGVIDHRWNTSASFDLFSDDDVTTFYGVAAAFDVLSFSNNIDIAVELGWNTGNSHRTGLLGGSISRTELFTHNVQAGVTARMELLPWLAPHARLTAGLSVMDMSLHSQVDDLTFSDHKLAPYVGLGLGASIQTTPRALTTKHGHLSSLRLGVRFELGYTLAGTAGFSLTADDDLRVPVTDASAGGLSRSGPYIHTAAFVRL